MKVFITGVGSDIGTAIAQKLERSSQVTQIAGIDLYPPRRYLARTIFDLYKIGDFEQVKHSLEAFKPDVLINFGLYEPGSRLDGPQSSQATKTILDGVEKYSQSLLKSFKIITRSSVSVYGFHDPVHTFDETSPLNPDTLYGELCCETEERLRRITQELTTIRSAPEIGAHVPHPLARVLLQPIVPAQLRLPFSTEVGIPITSPRDVAEMFVRCVSDQKAVNRVFHCVTPGNITINQAASIGKRIPLYATGIAFAAIKQFAFYTGAPIDEHIEMLIRRGMKIDSTATRMIFDNFKFDTSKEILQSLYGDEEKVLDNPQTAEVL